MSHRLWSWPFPVIGPSHSPFLLYGLCYRPFPAIDPLLSAFLSHGLCYRSFPVIGPLLPALFVAWALLLAVPYYRPLTNSPFLRHRLSFRPFLLPATYYLGLATVFFCYLGLAICLFYYRHLTISPFYFMGFPTRPFCYWPPLSAPSASWTLPPTHLPGQATGLFGYLSFATGFFCYMGLPTSIFPLTYKEVMIWKRKGREMKGGTFLLHSPATGPCRRSALTTMGLVTGFYHLGLATGLPTIQALLLGSSCNLEFLLALFYHGFTTGFFYYLGLRKFFLHRASLATLIFLEFRPAESGS